MLYIVEGVLGLLIFIFGSCIFSFLNVLIYRIPLKENFIQGRSKCTNCGHALSYRDMVPIVSWLCLRGKCRYCGVKISGRYSEVELLGGVTALFCVYKYSFSATGLCAFALICVLTTVAFIDWDTMEIPDGFHVAILVIAIIALVFVRNQTIVSALIGVICVSVPMLLLTFFIPGGFGGGDIKLMAAVGLYLGWKLTILAFFLGVVAGGLYGVFLLAKKKAKKNDHFAFGPFLCVGIVVAMFWGEQILSWYLGFFPKG